MSWIAHLLDNPFTRRHPGWSRASLPGLAPREGPCGM